MNATSNYEVIGVYNKIIKSEGFNNAYGTYNSIHSASGISYGTSNYVSNSSNGYTATGSSNLGTHDGPFGAAYGVIGAANGTSNSEKFGVFGYAVMGNGTKYAIYGDAGGGNNLYAGYFNGAVNVTGNISKGGGSFKIDHPSDPENKFLYHSFVESPDMKNIYDGVTITDDNGNATVELPSYFEDLNKDFRYQLTTIGSFSQAIISEEIVKNSFSIKTDKPNIKVSWQVTGIRHDAFAEQNRIITEVQKNSNEKGKFLHPEAFKKTSNMGIIQNQYIDNLINHKID
ncbi:MAG: hypothetical protein IPH28_17740 [Cytophagaceae bacterium]|nr:hypothetical protein [Cytophagaceae bacterium]